MQLSQLYVHPLKSGRGIAYSRAYAGLQGLLHDREWLITLPDGQFITARDEAKLVTLRVTPLAGALLLHAPGRAPIAALTPVYTEPVATTVWRDHFTAQHGDPDVDAYLSDWLGKPCQLLWLGAKPTRSQKTIAAPLSFADGYPYLLINRVSLDALNEMLPRPVTERHFRPNLVIDGALPWEEDDWQVLKIGDIVFDVAKPCTRCVLTTIDPELGERDPGGEPLKTLIRTRQLPEGICFGVNLVARSEGILEVGAPVEVLEGKYRF
ncbi:MOSC domain-containing protein [Crenobacter sp. SG2303]|uniref:MOSC domain-containing protein n=1 Tax=Crenobacter oryzisoli TaxID=3056844 RepID=A0ABT7XQ24_9NEIS|nr:MOSC domain-containing protein [Crenobacter sp. SG2303]MDN0075901.1 MOSC domain-containing protein [Crenobacter sp. SG2303]